VAETLDEFAAFSWRYHLMDDFMLTTDVCTPLRLLCR
jgi:hypothetical protein